MRLVIAPQRRIDPDGPLYDKLYYLKKRFALYPGIASPISATFLAGHYRARQRERGLARALLDRVLGTAFKAWVPFRARAVAKRFGLDDAWVRQATQIGRARFADPNDLALFRIDHASAMDDLMRRYEAAGISKIVNPANWRPDCVLADKIAFAPRCAEHGIAHPALLASIVDGALEVHALPRQPDVVLKPAAGEGGSGVKLLTAPDAAMRDLGALAAFSRAACEKPPRQVAGAAAAGQSSRHGRPGDQRAGNRAPDHDPQRAR